MALRARTLSLWPKGSYEGFFLKSESEASEFHKELRHHSALCAGCWGPLQAAEHTLWGHD